MSGINIVNTITIKHPIDTLKKRSIKKLELEILTNKVGSNAENMYKLLTSIVVINATAIK
ncbi:hypothetical protein fh0823_02230 [Francisella halioticida]|nr:hypothetical protein fh0823_02230 [Francisella halioticida]